MYIQPEQFFHLTYCTNIHPGHGWDEVFAQLKQYVLELKRHHAPHDAFGIGLRLSGRESVELLQGDTLQHFRAFLREHQLYVFTLNGFPYDPFHREPFKANVHSPDSREEERVQYTLRLINILAALLPDGVNGSIATTPPSSKTLVNAQDESTWQIFTRNIVRIASTLERNQQESHVHISPAL